MIDLMNDLRDWTHSCFSQVDRTLLGRHLVAISYDEAESGELIIGTQMKLLNQSTHIESLECDQVDNGKSCRSSSGPRSHLSLVIGLRLLVCSDQKI